MLTDSKMREETEMNVSQLLQPGAIRAGQDWKPFGLSDDANVKLFQLFLFYAACLPLDMHSRCYMGALRRHR